MTDTLTVSRPVMSGMVWLRIGVLNGGRGRVRRVVPTMVTAGVVNGARCD